MSLFTAEIANSASQNHLAGFEEPFEAGERGEREGRGGKKETKATRENSENKFLVTALVIALFDRLYDFLF